MNRHLFLIAMFVFGLLPIREALGGVEYDTANIANEFTDYELTGIADIAVGKPKINLTPGYPDAPRLYIADELSEFVLFAHLKELGGALQLFTPRYHHFANVPMLQPTGIYSTGDCGGHEMVSCLT